MTQKRRSGFEGIIGAGVILAVLSVVWGTQFLVIKTAQIDIPPLLGGAVRFLVLAILAQIAVTALRSKAEPGLGAGRLFFATSQAVCMSLMHWAQGGMDSSLAGILFTTSPLFVGLLAHHYVPGERLGRRSAATLILGFAGVVVITAGAAAPSSAHAPELMAVVAILGAALAGAFNKIFAKNLTSRVPAPVLLRDMGVVVTLVAAAGWALLEGDEPVRWTLRATFSLVYLGAVASAAASAMYLLLLRRFPVSAMAYLQFITAAIALATGVVVAGEVLGVSSALGSVLVLAGLALLAGSKRSG